MTSCIENKTSDVVNYLPPIEIALSPMVKEIAKILRFRILAKNSKNQNGRHFVKSVGKWV